MEAKESDEAPTEEPSQELSYMNPREAISEEFPMQPELIKKYQNKDRELQKKAMKTKGTKFSS